MITYISVSKKGFILKIIIIIVALIALGIYFRIDIVGIIKKPETQNILKGLWNGLRATFNYLKSLLHT